MMKFPNMVIENNKERYKKILSWGYCDFSNELTKDMIQIQSPTDTLPMIDIEQEEHIFDSINNEITIAKLEEQETNDPFTQIMEELGDIKLRLGRLEKNG